MITHHFGLTHIPLSKQTKTLWDDGMLAHLNTRFQWLLQSPGIGLLTGEPGVGKTAWLRQVTETLNPHRYQVIYLAETDFGRFDLYRQLAIEFGLEPTYRRAPLWRDIKQHITMMVEHKQILPLWIIDESHNLPLDFFRDFSSFLNFAFDSKDLMTVWLVGQPSLANLLQRAPYTALASRIQIKETLQPIVDKQRFVQMIQHAFEEAGARQPLLSESGIELIRMASKGRIRTASLVIRQSLHLAMLKEINHLPDDLIKQAIEDLK